MYTNFLEYLTQPCMNLTNVFKKLYKQLCKTKLFFLYYGKCKHFLFSRTGDKPADRFDKISDLNCGPASGDAQNVRNFVLFSFLLFLTLN